MTKKTASKQDKQSFKQLQDELDQVLRRVETAEYDELEEMLKDYEHGKKLIAALEKKLLQAENSITVVNKTAGSD